MSIQILAPEVAERIAAGEVVERPASVVKELVENAIDAGATHIAIRLEEGGRSLIEVLDNGQGMNAQDLELCTLRHATSKIHQLQDLDHLQSLGFRGEALPSIAAVSDLQILSRPKGSDETRQVSVSVHHPKAKSETVSFGHFHGDDHGTRIRVQGLFAQVPARLKFLKSPRAEVSQVREWTERLALTHPQIQFEFMHEERSLLKISAQDEEQRVRQLLGDGDHTPVKSIKLSPEQNARYGQGISIRLHWLQGISLPQSRRMVQVLNGRVLKDRLIQSALSQGFKQILLPGQFPALTLYLEVDPSDLDCNVHPTKTEVRFLNGQGVFRAVRKAVESLVQTQGAPRYAPASLGKASLTPADQNSLSLKSNPSWTPKTEPPSASFPQAVAQVEAQAKSHAGADRQPSKIEINLNPNPEPPIEPAHPFEGFEYRGSLFATYLFFEREEEALLLDQHAAHERIRYEELRQQIVKDQSIPQSQDLLMPEHLKFSPEQRARLSDRMKWLEELGFQSELFSENAILFRAIPAAWGESNLRTRLKSLVERVLHLEVSDLKQEPQKLKELLLDEVLFESLASKACRSSIMAGDRLDPHGVQAHSLLNRLFECEHPWNCPHGRPSVVKVARTRIEEWFQRKI